MVKRKRGKQTNKQGSHLQAACLFILPFVASSLFLLLELWSHNWSLSGKQNAGVRAFQMSSLEPHTWQRICWVPTVCQNSIHLLHPLPMGLTETFRGVSVELTLGLDIFVDKRWVPHRMLLVPWWYSDSTFVSSTSTKWAAPLEEFHTGERKSEGTNLSIVTILCLSVVIHFMSSPSLKTSLVVEFTYMSSTLSLLQQKLVD